MLAARLSMSRSSEPIVAWRAAFDAFLCGVDRYSGQNFDHRKTWIRHRLEQLAGIMAIDVLSFAVLSNHLHVMLRIRPDIAAAWSDEEVARRWWRLHPGRRNEGGTPAEPEPHELATLLADAEALAKRRRRLSTLSWFMAALCEPIARRANREDRLTGRFWEGSIWSCSTGRGGKFAATSAGRFPRACNRSWSGCRSMSMAGCRP